MIVKKYAWKELSNDGLLKDVEDEGPYYSRESLNPYGGGFDSEKEAIDALELWVESYRFSIGSSLTLIIFYEVSNDS
jgi:hypothetical protein